MSGTMPRAHGAPVLTATIRQTPEDFRVDEIDAFEASGSGEHLLLTIEKSGMNTAFVARLLAQWAGVDARNVGYAGLKDRHALTTGDFLDWGWRYPFFVAFAINVVALFARLRIVATPEFEEMFASRELQPSSIRETVRNEGRVILLGAFAPLASFAMFHLVTVYPLSWIVLFTQQAPVRFLVIEMIGACFGVLSILASGILADRVGRRTVLGVSAVAIAAYSGFAPQLLNGGDLGETIYTILGFILLGLAFGQSSGVIASQFTIVRRYTASALTSDLAWLVGAGFAPLAALMLSSNFGLLSVGAYLLSGSICTLGALYLNKEMGKRMN